MNRALAPALVIASMGGHRSLFNGSVVSFGYVSRDTLNNPSGSTSIQLRRTRQDRRRDAMRLRLLRGRR